MSQFIRVLDEADFSPLRKIKHVRGDPTTSFMLALYTKVKTGINIDIDMPDELPPHLERVLKLYEAHTGTKVKRNNEIQIAEGLTLSFIETDFAKVIYWDQDEETEPTPIFAIKQHLPCYIITKHSNVRNIFPYFEFKHLSTFPFDTWSDIYYVEEKVENHSRSADSIVPIAAVLTSDLFSLHHIHSASTTNRHNTVEFFCISCLEHTRQGFSSRTLWCDLFDRYRDDIKHTNDLKTELKLYFPSILYKVFPPMAGQNVFGDHMRLVRNARLIIHTPIITQPLVDVNDLAMFLSPTGTVTDAKTLILQSITEQGKNLTIGTGERGGFVYMGPYNSELFDRKQTVVFKCVDHNENFETMHIRQTSSSTLEFAIKPTGQCEKCMCFVAVTTQPELSKRLNPYKIENGAKK